MYFPVRLLICTVYSLINTSSLLIVRALKWKYGRGFPSPRRKGITRYWDLVLSTLSWGFMNKITVIRSSNPFPYCMWVTSLTCDFGAFDDDMVVFLKIWTLSALENDSKLSFTVIYLEWVSGWRRSLVTSQFSAFSFSYSGHVLFVDRYWQNIEWMASHYFWSWRDVYPYRVMCDRCLVSYEACEWKYGDLRSGNLFISAEGWL